MKGIIVLMLVSLLFFSAAMAQDYTWREGGRYDNARIQLTSGAVIQTKNISVSGSEILVYSDALAAAKNYNVADIKQVEVPTKNKLLVGALVGTAVGVGAMLLIESNYEKPETTHDSGPGWTSTTTVTKEMPDVEKIPIVLGGTALGAWIGSTIKSGWKKIYPNENLSLKVSLPKRGSMYPGLSFQLNF